MNKAKLSGVLTSMMVVAVTPSFGEQMVQPMETEERLERVVGQKCHKDRPAAHA